ncbi:hypothetical protein ACF0H5_002698 [Mactra antiquata]
MEEEEERIRYEEEEVTTIHRKTIKTQSTTKRRKKKATESSTVKTEIVLNPHLHGVKQRDLYQNKSHNNVNIPDHVQKLVRETLNEYQGSELPHMKNSNRVFLGAMDSDDDDDDDRATVDTSDKKESVSAGDQRVNNKRKGIDRFRKIVDFVILAQNIFTVRRSVNLNRRDSILFFMDREKTMDVYNGGTQPKFDVNAFKGIGQKTKMASVKSFLDVPPSQRTDGQINHMMHSLRAFNKFSNYPNAVQTGLCQKGWYSRFEASKVIVKEGNSADFYYLILSGIATYRDIDVDYDDLNGNKQIATYLHPGDTIGEREILTNTDRPATIICKEPVEVLGVDRDTLLDIFKASGGQGSVDFLKTIPELSDFPLELLQTYHFSMAVHYYRRGAVIVKSSNESEWIYIVRTGSCQVYKAIKDHHRKDKHLQSRPVSSNKYQQKENNGVMLPNINLHRNDRLESASNVEITDPSEKKNTKKKKSPLERSKTMLPSLNPGKTSLVNSPPNMSPKTPRKLDKRKEHKNGDSHCSKKRMSLESVDSSRSKQLPDILKPNRSDSIVCETPEAVLKTRQKYVQSPAIENSKTKRQHRRRSIGSSIEGGIQSRKPSSDSNVPDVPNQPDVDITDEGSTGDNTGSMFYVRLGNISTKGVFGLHPLVYDDMPNLSLVSNGAECVLVSKQFLKDNMTSIVAHRLKNKLPPYPSSGQLRSALDDKINWENYREKVVSNVLK